MLQIRGRFESPRVTGDITFGQSELKVDEILDRTLFQPYSTEQTVTTQVDAVAALNPWERLGLDITLHVPDSLKLTGTDVQIFAGHADRIGDINLRVAGDLICTRIRRSRCTSPGRSIRSAERMSFRENVSRSSRRARSTSVAI